MQGKKRWSDLKVLLLQMRKDEKMLPAERDNFLAHSALKKDQLISLDVYRSYDFPAEMIDDYDAFFVGGLSSDPSGSSEISLEIFPFLHSFNALLSRARIRKLPGLLSCGGFMLASVYWGSEIKIDSDRNEMGVYDLEILKAAKNDPLMSHLPPLIKIISGHIKSTMFTPPNSILLASTKRCPIHAVKLKDAPIYAFQGHPEITCADLKARVSAYKEKYFKNDAEYHRFLNLNEDTSWANELIRRFLELVVSGQINTTNI